jgi:phage-related minor tail protein
MATDFGEADPLETARKKARDGIRQIGQEWQAIVARSMENMKGGIGGFFSSVAKGIKDSIQQMLLELVKQKIFSQLFGAKAGAQTFGNNPLGAILGMAGGGPLGGILGGVLGGIKKIFRFADGGIPPIGVPSLVGERGPELFVPRSGGYVVPNHQLSGAAGGGGGVNVTFQNYGGIHKEADEHRVADRISREVHTALRMM